MNRQRHEEGLRRLVRGDATYATITDVDATASCPGAGSSVMSGRNRRRVQKNTKYKRDRSNWHVHQSFAFIMGAHVWPQSIHDRFASIPVNPYDNGVYGPYNKLLSLLFPPESPFTVVPCLPEFRVFWGRVQVFTLEIKTETSFGLVSERDEADRRIRSRLRDWVDNSPLPKLHAVSAFGTKLCFYSLEPGQAITPPRIPGQFDTAPIGRWNYDVLEDEGAAHLKAIVSEIHEFCTQLDPGEQMFFWISAIRKD